MPKFQLKLDGEWKDYTATEQDILRRAFMEDEAGVRFRSRGQDYYCDFARMVQRNLGSGKERELRAVHDSDVKSHSGKPCVDADAALAQALQDKLDQERLAAQTAHAAQPAYVPGVAAAGAAPCPPSGCVPGHGAGGYAAAAPPPYAPAPQPYAPGYGAGGYAAAAPPPYAQPYTSGGYAAAAPPPYAPAAQHYGPSAYGAAPASGPGMGISPMTAGLMGAGAGLLGGLILDDVF